MKRRSFLAGIIAASAAPAIVRASSLMPIVVPRGFRIPDLRGWDIGWEGGDRFVITRVELGNGPYVPQGWVRPDGRLLVRDRYPVLFETVLVADDGAVLRSQTRLGGRA